MLNVEFFSIGSFCFSKLAFISLKRPPLITSFSRCVVVVLSTRIVVNAVVISVTLSLPTSEDVVSFVSFSFNHFVFAGV